MAIRRIHRKTDRTPEQRAERDAVRAEFQATKPSLDDLVASGDYEVRRHGDVMEGMAKGDGTPTATTNPKYPAVRIKLSGVDGNAFVILGRCQAAATNGGVPTGEISAFVAEAMDGDYDHMLRTCMKWFNVR